MSPRRVLAILVKDLRDAWRDGRIVLLLVMPIGIALLPSISGDADALPTAKVAIVGAGDGAVARELRRATGKSVRIETVRAADAAAARRLVAREGVELAVVVMPGRRSPRAEILVGEGATPAAQSVAALLPSALARAAGVPPGVQARVRVVPAVDRKPIDGVGPRALSMVFAIILLATFVAMMIVPIQTAEELETGTFGALRLAATAREILAAKALAGYVYGSAGVGLTLLLTNTSVHDPLLFFGAAFALIVSLVGFGLLLGLLAPNSNAINSYGAFLVMPLVGTSVAVFVVESGTFAWVFDVLPFSQAARLLADGLSVQTPFDAGPLAWLVIAAWAVLGYSALVRIASRREV
jgi:hypothetical protein